MHNYHSSKECLPAAYLPDRSGRPTDSWRMAILPYMEQTQLFNSCNFAFAWDAAENSTTINTRMSIFARPEDSQTGPTVAKFLAVVGPRTPFPGPVNRTFADIKDGLATTLMFGEVAESDIHWAAPRDLKRPDIDPRINGPSRKRSFGSPYGGARVLMMDTSVRTLNDRTPPATLRALLTIDGGEAIPGWDGVR